MIWPQFGEHHGAELGLKTPCLKEAEQSEIKARSEEGQAEAWASLATPGWPRAAPREVITLTFHGTSDRHICLRGCLHGASNHDRQMVVLWSADVSFRGQDDGRLLIERDRKFC